MFRAINTWLHDFAIGLAQLIHGREVAIEGMGPVAKSEPLDLEGWHVILVGDLQQAKSALACLSRKSHSELLPMGSRGYLVRWK